MKVWIFINNDNEVICRKAGKVYVSKDVDKFITFRREADIRNASRDVFNDNSYWGIRGIDINIFKPTYVELGYKKI